MNTNLRALPALNTNYDPPQPWRCVTYETHVCSGVVVGEVGVPVCAAGAVAEGAAQDADRAYWSAWADSPAGRAEGAAERRLESRVS